MQIPVLVGILSDLLSSDKLRNANFFAQKYEMSLRSVYRYVDMLCESGIPIQSRPGPSGGWGIIDSYKLKATYFTAEEFERLAFAVKSFSLQDELTVRSADKLFSLRRAVTDAYVLRSEQLVVDCSDANVREAVNAFSCAIASNFLIKLEYHSKEGEVTEREVEPYSLILKENAWYVYCYCRLRQDFRYFKISRIAHFETEKESFKPRVFNVNSEAIESEVNKDKETAEVLLSVDKKALAAVEEWFGLRRVAKVGEGYVAKATLPYDELLIGRILSLGDGVVVERPSKLRKAVAERCVSIRNHYEKND